VASAVFLQQICTDPVPAPHVVGLHPGLNTGCPRCSLRGEAGWQPARICKLAGQTWAKFLPLRTSKLVAVVGY